MLLISCSSTGRLIFRKSDKLYLKLSPVLMIFRTPNQLFYHSVYLQVEYKKTGTVKLCIVCTNAMNCFDRVNCTLGRK